MAGRKRQKFTIHINKARRRLLHTHISFFGALILLITLGISAWAIQRLVYNHSYAQNTTTKRLRVIEVRYIPTTPVYQPDMLSSQLQKLLSTASTFHASANAVPAISPEIVAVINHYTARPNPDPTSWGASYQAMLAADNLCQVIHDQKIDQIWLWVDPRGVDPAPGVEYVISSRMFQRGLLYVTAATPAFCNGTDSFVIMGFDDSRTVDLALHSYGHLLEGLIGNLQTVDLFWYRYAGDPSTAFPRTQRCGNVHFPPNANKAYDYNNSRRVDSFCDNWDPNGSSATTRINCTRWNCTQEGYLTWWMQNMPNIGNTLVYQGKTLPNWWDFLVDMDYSIPFYYNNSSYFMNRAVLDLNLPLPTNTPRAVPSPTPTPTPTATPTLTPTPTASAEPTSTPTDTPKGKEREA